MEGLVDAGDAEGALQLRMGCEEVGDLIGVTLLADVVRDVDSEEVTRRQESRKGLEVDVIRVENVGLAPAQCFDGGVGCGYACRSAQSR